MRINAYIALCTGISRRAADKAVEEDRVTINGQVAIIGQDVSASSKVSLNGKLISKPTRQIVIMLNKPGGYVCSRSGQGSKTIYELLPSNMRNLKPVGRLDKDSTGLLLLTNNGWLAHELTHPSFIKEKTYEVKLDKILGQNDKEKIKTGVMLDGGTSKLSVHSLSHDSDNRLFFVSMSEGRNRQIRRTFSALGYKVIKLHRLEFGPYKLGVLKPGDWKFIKTLV